MQRVRRGIFRPFSKLTRYLHIMMMGLSICASMALFLLDSIIYKLIISFILLAYIRFIFTKANALEQILQITGANIKASYLKIHQWSEGQSTSVEKKQDDNLKSNSRQQKSLDNSRSLQRSFVEQDSLSKSFSRVDNSLSKSRSLLNQSSLSNSRFSSQVSASGKDLMNLSFMNESSISMKRSTISNQNNIQIFDRKYLARKNMGGRQDENDNTFEKQLREINKTVKHAHSKYKTILNYINKVINPIINQHKTNTQRIKEFAIQYLQIIIDEQFTNNQQKFIYSSKPQKITRISTNNLIERFVYAYSRMIPLQHVHFTKKQNKSWSELTRKFNQLMDRRIQFAENIGINTNSLASGLKKDCHPFIQQYNSYITMIENYINVDILNKRDLQLQIQDQKEEYLANQFKSRIYILYLFVKSLNKLLNGAVKIELKDFLGFKKAVTGDIDFEISPKHSFDAYIPYFTLHAYEKKAKVKQYVCEYGSSNYLSIIYLLMFYLSKKTQAIRYRDQVTTMITQIL